MSPILEYLTGEQAAMIKLLEQWVNQDSPTHDKPSVDQMGQMIVDAFVRAGATLTATHPQTLAGDHYTLTYGEGESQILFLCHFDTVWPLGEASHRPFTIEDGRALGPGVHDMKAGVLMSLYLLQTLRALALQPRYKLVWLLTSDEEIGSLTSRELIESEGRRSSYCFVPEGSHNGSYLTTARKGVGRFHVEAMGIAAHAGVEPEKGVSAIQELSYQIQALHALNDLERGLTVNVGVIAGGERTNVIAAKATAEIDMRAKTRADAEAVSQAIYGLQPRVKGCQIKISGGINRWPFEESPAGLALFDKASRIADGLGFSVEQYASGGGSDGNFVAALGVPTLDGVGSLGGGAHALHEYTILEGLPLRTAMLTELIMQL